MQHNVKINIDADGRKAQREITKVAKTLGNLDGESQVSAKNMKLLGLAVGTGMGLGAHAILLGGRAAVKAAGDMEVLNTAFTTLLGSASAAKKTMADLYKFAAETPFEDADVYRFGRSLLAAGFQAKDLTKVLKQVGDAVSAVGGGAAGMDRVIEALSDMRSKGKVSQEELNQIGKLGIPAQKILQEQLNLTAKEMENIGKAGIPAEKAIDALVKGMAKFGAGGLEKQSKTLVGLASTLSGEIKNLLTNVEGTGIGDRMLPGVKAAVANILTEFKRLEADGTLKRFAADMSRELMRGFSALRAGITFLLRNGDKVVTALKWGAMAVSISYVVGGITGLISGLKGLWTVVGVVKSLADAFLVLKAAQLGAAAGTSGFLTGMAGIMTKIPGWLGALALLAGGAYAAFAWVRKTEKDRMKVANDQRRGHQFEQAQAALYMKAVTRYPELGKGRGTFVKVPGRDRVLSIDEWNKQPEAERQNLRRQGRVLLNTETVGEAATPSTYPTLSGGGRGDIAPNPLERQAGITKPKLRVLTKSVTVKGRQGELDWVPVGFASEAQRKLSMQKVIAAFEQKEIEAEIEENSKRLFAGAQEEVLGGAESKIPTERPQTWSEYVQNDLMPALGMYLKPDERKGLDATPLERGRLRIESPNLADPNFRNLLLRGLGPEEWGANYRDGAMYFKRRSEQEQARIRDDKEIADAQRKADEEASERQRQIAEEQQRAADEQRRTEEEAAERRWTALEDFKTSVENLDEAQRENHRTRIDEMLERESQSKTLSDQEKANIIAEFETWWALEIKRKKARQEELRTMAAVALITGDFLRAARLQIEAIAAGIAVSDTEIARDSDIAGIKKKLEPEPVEAPETWRDRWRKEWEERAKIAEQAMEGIVQSFSSRLVDGLTGAKDAWKNFWKDLKNIALNAIKAIIEAWIKGQVSGVGGQVSGGQAGVSAVMSTAMQAAGLPVQGGMVPNALMPQGGQGGGMPNMLGSLLGKKVGASTLGGALGAGMLGYSLAPMLFGKNNHSGAGGGMGAMLGMALGGPLGALAGGLLGGALGSLFKKRRKPKPQAPGGFWEPNLYGWGMDQGAPAVGVTPYQQQNPWNRPGPGIQVQQNIYNTSPRPIDGLSQDLADRVARAGRVK